MLGIIYGDGEEGMECESVGAASDGGNEGVTEGCMVEVRLNGSSIYGKPSSELRHYDTHFVGVIFS